MVQQNCLKNHERVLRNQNFKPKLHENNFVNNFESISLDREGSQKIDETTKAECFFIGHLRSS